MALVSNKKAHRDYALLEKFEAGMELVGTEVKSLRSGNAKLDGARVVVRGNEAFLVGAHIAPYQPKNTDEQYDPTRTRRLLLSHKEIQNLLSAESTKGLTIVPISVYNKGRTLKLEIAIAKGKKQYDKREDIKKRDTERRLKRKEY